SSRSLCLPPARMHFWVSAARVSEAGRTPAHLETSGARSPRKMGTNWFMPALVKSSPGESGRSEDDGTIVCFCWWKKSRKDWRICAEVMGRGKAASTRGGAGEGKPAGEDACGEAARGDALTMSS